MKSNKIKQNLSFFEIKVKEYRDTEKIFSAIRKLVIVDIALDKELDNPQLIFESLNSTGLELSQADLIRNYILMGLDLKNQTYIYKDYWQVMEESFGQENYSTLFDRFMRDYLTIKMGYIPNIKTVYETFKKLYQREGGSENINDIVADIYKYSKYFINMALEKEKHLKLKQQFHELNELQVAVAYPFLLSIYDDYSENIITDETFLEILMLVQSYVFRRFICNYATNALNKVFSCSI